MELDHVLLFTAVASAGLVLLRSWRMQARGVRAAAAFVLLVAALAWLFAREIAGVISTLAWLSFVLVPSLIRNRALRRSGNGRELIRTALTPAVTLMVAANLLLFAIELVAGGSTNSETLYRLGELDTEAVRFGHQYWRLGTALFLHYGPLHLLFNLWALLLLGPPLEREIGTLPFAFVYLLAGLGSSASVLALTLLHLSPPVQLVGASGCVMGIVGVWAGVLLRDRTAPLARMRLRNIGLIIALQVIFDLITPQVSMSAHLGGLVTGFVLGLLLVRNSRALPHQPLRGM